ncbi:MAG: hypothetical protein K2N11_08090 [Mucispirillum sp.]|nr:hypothetical protein [Mucispirillum sp.]
MLIFFITGCSGTLFGYDNLDSLYKNSINNMDISVYYNTVDGCISAAVKNVSSTFMTNLNISMECEYNNGYIVTDIHSLSSLKTYFYKNIVFQIDYEKCKSLVLKYIYYPQEDGGFMYADRFGSYPIPVSNDIPVDGALVIK